MEKRYFGLKGGRVDSAIEADSRKEAVEADAVDSEYILEVDEHSLGFIMSAFGIGE